MKPAPFAYHAPETVSDVVSLLRDLGEDTKVLAGGQSRGKELALRLTRFPHLVDLNRVAALAGVTRDDGHLVIGAMTRQADVEGDGAVAAAAPLLARATPLIGHFQIRNRGTVGGSIAHADPAAEYPAVALALDAKLELVSAAGTRVVPASEFFVSTFMTAVEADEVLTAIDFPVWAGRCGFAVEEVARRLGDFALTGAACAVELDDGNRIARAAIGMFGMGSTPLRAPEAEAALTGNPVTDADVAEVGRTAAAESEPPGDVHASPAYRRAVGAVVVARALRAAIEEARRA